MAYEPLNLQNGQTLTAEDLQHMEQGILGVLPQNPGAYQYPATDGDGNMVWAPMLAYEQTTTQVLCDVADAGEYQRYVEGIDGFKVENIPAIYPQGIIAGQSYTVEIGDETIQVVANSQNQLAFFDWSDYGYNVTVTQNANTYTVSEDGGAGGQFLQGYSFKITRNVTELKQIDPKDLPTGTVIVGQEAGTANQQLVTDADGNATWVDALASESTQNVVIQEEASIGAGPITGAKTGYSATGGVLSPNAIILGDTYIVEFDGVAYTMIAREVTNDAVIDNPNGNYINIGMGASLGDYSGEYPVSIYAYSNSMYFDCGDKGIGRHSLKITHVATTVSTIDPKFLFPTLNANSTREEKLAVVKSFAPHVYTYTPEPQKSTSNSGGFTTTTLRACTCALVMDYEVKRLVDNDYGTTEYSLTAYTVQGSTAGTVNRTQVWTLAPLSSDEFDAIQTAWGLS